MIANLNKKIKNDPTKVFLQIAGILFLIAVVALLLADFKMYQRKRELKVEIESYEKKIKAIKENTAKLQEEIANTDNQEYLEKIAYEQGMVKTGEKQVIFVVPDKKQTEEDKKQNNFWGAFTGWLSGAWSWIKNKF